MATREIGVGLYDVRRPATSPTRSGAAKGRPQPRGLTYSRQLRQPAFTPSPPHPLAAAAEPRQSVHTCATVDIAAAQRVAAASAPASSSSAASVAEVTSRVSTNAEAWRRGHDGASDVAAHMSSNASAHPLSQLAPTIMTASSSLSLPSSAAYIETQIRCVVHPVGPPVLMPSLLDILHGVLRELQHDRTQQKGQQPCRRHSGLSTGDVEGDVTSCLTRAAQALTPSAAAAILERFLVARAAGAAALAAPPLTSPPTATVSPVVLIGATLAELYFSGRAPVCNVSPSALLSFLDSAVAAGHPAAMLCVGGCLRDGRGGVAQNVGAGLAWMRCAAATGYLPAMHELGETYEVGAPLSSSPSSTRSFEVEEEGGVDWGEAMRWYRQAAEAGYAPSQLNLGKLLLLAAEQGVHDESADNDAVGHLSAEAKRWLQACAAAGVEEGVRLLQRMQ